jgi:D-alanyl-lipoteichoic acid acyltransferase DltB (MBOAT superfamily)
VLGEWIVIAWEGISSEYVVTGFKICCISNALDGTENDFLRQSEENRVIVKKMVVVMMIMMTSKVRMRTLNKNLHFKECKYVVGVT